MAQRGNEYTVSLKLPHLNWGDYRNETNRDVIHDEGYIPIPRKYAKEFDIFNSNNLDTGLGYNLFYASSLDGFLNNVTLLAQGSQKKEDIYAKQFSVQGNLKMIGRWYQSQNATLEDSVRVRWTSPTEIILEIVRM